MRKLTIANHETGFNISTASEMMAILCLAKDEQDLKERLGNILVGYTYTGKEVLAKDLNCVNALFLLLKQAIHPNLVRTLEDNLSLVHGGPFANIAHGTASVIALEYALTHFDYSVVEAGFGSDMGGVKFFDIVARLNPQFIPDVVVLNTTVQSLIYNGEGSLEKGIANLDYHINLMSKYSPNLIVILNQHSTDTESQINYIKDYVMNKGILFSVSNGYQQGSAGTLDCVKKIVNMHIKDKTNFTYSYELNDSVQAKIEKFCCQNYGAKNVVFTNNALTKLAKIEKSKFKNSPICIAKTQYSITDNAKILGYPKDFTMTVSDIKLFSGAGFITAYFGSILTMPGLTKDANYLTM